MNIRPTSVLTEDQVIEILERLDAGEFQHSIAARYGVSTKTISRINTGETWSDITQRYRVKDHLVGANLPVINLVPMKDNVIDTIDEVIAIKNHFGFSFEHPLHWGWFDAWDGLHSVVSDGIIVWESADLVKYAQKLATSGIDKHPVWAKYAEELPTFDLEDIMTLPVGPKFTSVIETECAVKLVTGNQTVYIHQKFANIARKMKLDIRCAGRSREYVYLTKLKPKSSSDPTNIVIACVAVIK